MMACNQKEKKDEVGVHLGGWLVDGLVGDVGW
jgi:hypothetical protein